MITFKLSKYVFIYLGNIFVSEVCFWISSSDSHSEIAKNIISSLKRYNSASSNIIVLEALLKFLSDPSKTEICMRTTADGFIDGQEVSDIVISDSAATRIPEVLRENLAYLSHCQLGNAQNQKYKSM